VGYEYKKGDPVTIVRNRAGGRHPQQTRRLTPGEIIEVYECLPIGGPNNEHVIKYLIYRGSDTLTNWVYANDVRPGGCICPIAQLSSGDGCTCGDFEREMGQKYPLPVVEDDIVAKWNWPKSDF
jgi:hypothetical protein